MPATLVVASPIGPLELATRDGERLSAIRFDAEPAVAVAGSGGHGKNDGVPVLQEAARQLGEYFAGARRVFDLPLDQRGTAFQLAVWEELLLVPYATTVTYGWLAARLGLGNAASRAVGAANGANPIPVVVPCHRVIGSDGRLTGYGGGLDRKHALLRLEGVPTERDQLELF
jgi:methylated-DNA-[protein]-cysteine S-methyltransferase